MPRTSHIIPKILSGVPPKDTSGITNVLVRAHDRLSAWYGIRISLPAVILLQSRKSIEAYWGQPKPEWNTAWFDRGTIFILDWKVMQRLGYTRKGWEQVLVHEYTHMFTAELVGNKKPSWLNEGLSCFHAGQRRSVSNEKILQYFSEQQPKPEDAYAVGYVVVEGMIAKFGRKRVIQLLSEIRLDEGKHNFSTIFERVTLNSFGSFLKKLGKS